MKAFTGDSPAAAEEGVLPDRRELALVAVERTRMPMVVSDPRQPDSPIVLANRAFLDLTGYSAEEVIGRNCRFLQGPDTSPEAIDEMRRGLAADEHFVSVELLNYRKDGSTFWNQVSISPVHDDEGRTIYHFGSQIDVSERRRAQELEAIERLLLMEVDHRAMNALALVESVLSLTRASDVTRYSQAVRRRIEAIARTHRILARSSWTGTAVNDLIAEEAAKVEMQVEGPPAKLSPRLAQPIAIALHELISNARQHGAFLRAGGRVSLVWSISPGKLVLQWTEVGIEPVSLEPQPGLGLSLVRAVIEGQLGGTAAMNWNNQSFEAQLTVPIRAEDITTSPDAFS